MIDDKRPLKIFLCHAHDDKPKARDLYRYLKQRGLQPWLDAEDLLPGQKWEEEIPKALETSDVIIICLSKGSINKEGFVQKEIKFALDKALEMPEGRIFLIPARLEECDVPHSLSTYQWVDLFAEGGYEKLMKALKVRAEQLERANVEIQEFDDERSELKKLEGKAIGFELLGEFWEALQIYFEIKKRDPLFPRVDTKIKELERELEVLRWKIVADGFESQRNLRNALQIWQKIREINPSFALASTKISQLERELLFSRLKFGFLVGATILFAILVLPKIFTIPVAPSPTATITVFHPSDTPGTSLTPTATFTLTPMPSPTDISDVKGVPMRLVPAGEFIMGRENGDIDEKPVHKVVLDTFYIDKFEVTNARYKVCVEAGVCKAPVEPKSSTQPSYYGNPQFDNYPVIYVDWNRAQTYCEWREARLPTEAEWEKAARGTDGRTYPWGEEVNCSQANYLGCVGDTASAGNYTVNVSPYGVYDMAGNVWEWVMDWYSDGFYSISPGTNPHGPDSGTYRVVRGGAWDFAGQYVSSTDRFWGTPQSAGANFGFRCARDEDFLPGPSSVSILNREWNTYTLAGKNSKIDMLPKSGTDYSFHVPFTLQSGEMVAIYKKISQNALADSQGLIISYEGTGASNTLEVKLITITETLCKSVFRKATATKTTVDWKIPYSNFSCNTKVGKPVSLSLDDIDRIDLSLLNWPDYGDMPGEGDVFVHGIQIVPIP